MDTAGSNEGFIKRQTTNEAFIDASPINETPIDITFLDQSENLDRTLKTVNDRKLK